MGMMKYLLTISLILLLAACGPAGGEETSSSPSIYIENKGSDTLVNLALAWTERYQSMHPEVRLSVTGGGSGTGIAALMNNTVDIANASRKIKQEEIDMATSNGFIPIEFIVARDAIGIIVNHENPVNQLTMQQLADIFTGRIDNWAEVGGNDLQIVRVSRETNSGTHVYFLEVVIRLGSSESMDIFARDTLLLPSSEGIIAEVRDNPHAIGYDGLGYITDEVKVIAIAMDDQSAYILPSVETVNEGSYPIARDLYMYTPGEPPAPVKDYITWILSPAGQELVRELGFVPITP
ncbi:MAG: phosphate ABC transporter substrate-binding protein [Anaerolineaceae bacterium]|nr:phosphate ABC transporter substrate-binding protein [Anaerolineaceae bacterium]MBN2678514.1 phosphate ABC transporter substrate-binding protein [Anaerolineaceae bacterium]